MVDYILKGLIHMKKCLLTFKRLFGNFLGTFIYALLLFVLNVWPSLLALYISKKGSFIWAIVFLFLHYWISSVLSGILHSRGS